MTDLDARLRSAAGRVAEEVVETRRHLHRHPELSHVEHRTAELCARRCEELGFTVRGGVGGTGVLADLVRFVPNAGAIGSGSLTIKAWDQTSGTHGTVNPT